MILEMDANLVFYPSGEDEKCPVFTVRQVVEGTPGIGATELYRQLMSATGCSKPTAIAATKQALGLEHISCIERSKYRNFYPKGEWIGKQGAFTNL